MKVLSFIILLLAACSFINEEQMTFDEMAKDMSSKFSSPVITYNEFAKLSNSSDLQLLDAREVEEYNTSYIKNAIHVGHKEFNIEKTLKRISKNKKIIVYCSVGYRSGDIASQLRSRGYNAYNLQGGIFKWVNLGKPVYSMEKSQLKVTKRIHGFNKDWAKWLTRGDIKLSP